MRRLALIPLVVVAAFAIAACSNTSCSPVASAPAASAGGGGGGGGAGGCSVASGAGTATVEIKDFKYNPDPITAKVGDVISWTNGDSVPHTATLDEGDCGTEQLSQGASGGLTFTEAGTYTYHCAVHSNMKGTITIS